MRQKTVSRSVRPLGSYELPEATEVLAEAFGSYAVFAYVIGAGGPERVERVRTLADFFVRVRELRGEHVLGAFEGDLLRGVALVSDPGGPPSPPEVDELRDRVWAELGVEARSRYERFGKIAAELIADVPRLHLNMIGVRPEVRGRGIGSLLLREVHRLAATHPRAAGVSLTTEDPANVPLYRHAGYRESGHALVADGLTTWAMFRPNPPTPEA